MRKQPCILEDVSDAPFVRRNKKAIAIILPNRFAVVNAPACTPFKPGNRTQKGAFA